jgi:hypothetical protein
MLSHAFTLVSLVVISSSADSVQRTMREENESIRRCFELNQVDSGFLELRFTIDDDGRAKDPSIVAQTPEHEGLSRCILELFARVRFEAEARGADVAYPIRYQAAPDVAPAGAVSTPTHSKLSIVAREGSWFMDPWLSWSTDRPSMM